METNAFCSSIITVKLLKWHYEHAGAAFALLPGACPEALSDSLIPAFLLSAAGHLSPKQQHVKLPSLNLMDNLNLDWSI